MNNEFNVNDTTKSIFSIRKEADGFVFSIFYVAKGLTPMVAMITSLTDFGEDNLQALI